VEVHFFEAVGLCYTSAHSAGVWPLQNNDGQNSNKAWTIPHNVFRDRTYPVKETDERSRQDQLPLDSHRFST